MKGSYSNNKKLMFARMGNSEERSHATIASTSNSNNAASFLAPRSVPVATSSDPGALFRSVPMVGVASPFSTPFCITTPVAKTAPTPVTNPTIATTASTASTASTFPVLSSETAACITTPVTSASPATTPVATATATTINTPTPAAWTWKCPSQRLPSVPLFHPLERTALTLQDIPLDTITSRISTYLKQHSILADYQDTKVLCQTDSFLKFVIQLWRQDQRVIVEIQRRQGSCLEMQAVRHHLLARLLQDDQDQDDRATLASVASTTTTTTGGVAATAGTLADTARAAGTRSGTPDWSRLHDWVESTTAHASKPDAAAALDLVTPLLETPRVDAQRLGLESLLSLTNPTHCLWKESQRVSRTLLADPVWHARLTSHLAVQGAATNVCASHMHLLTLQVLAQAMEVVAADDDTQAASAMAAWMHSDAWIHAVLPTLWYHVEHATLFPMEASCAVRCLRHGQHVHVASLQAVLQSAHHVGQERHQALEDECHTWMNTLGMTVAE
eukprot:Nitzschia sp. Nitz4//scaffold242_size29646//15980//17488//NITZ4_008051-RA/size29646-processed-gene-0.19-mRNA-1//-1//CDS//3329543815//3324//frame0